MVDTRDWGALGRRRSEERNFQLEVVRIYCAVSVVTTVNDAMSGTRNPSEEVLSVLYARARAHTHLGTHTVLGVLTSLIVAILSRCVYQIIAPYSSHI